MRLIPALAAAILLTGCTAGPTQTVTVTAPAAASPTAEPSVNGWSHAQAFAEAALAGDYDTASKHVAPGGAAERYITHQKAMKEAEDAAGDSSDNNVTDVTYDSAAGTVTYTYDEDNAPTTTWKDFEYDSSGLVLGWATGKSSIKLADRLWSRPAKASSAHADVELVSAYKNDSGLFVVLDIHAKDRAITPDCSALLDDAKHRQRESDGCDAPDKIAKGNSAYIVLTFPGADFGGTLRYGVEDGNYNELGTLKLKIQ